MQIIAKQEDAGKRLDKWLVENLPHHSRSFLQQQIKAGNVLVNEKKSTVHRFLKSGDTISLNLDEKKELTLSPAEDKGIIVVVENDDYVVIEKPAGLVVHPAPGINEPTLADGLVHRYPETATIGDDPLRPGLVHRLDREVSGLLVVARKQPMFAHLKRQFQERLAVKEYTALVHGRVKENGTINTPIGRSQTKGGRMAAHPGQPTEEETKDKDARTDYEIIESYQNFTLLKVRIYTGRTHQIRVHLHSIGHPVAGDKLYSIKRYKPADLNRLFLHAAKLGFEDLSGEWKEFTSPLPEELQNFLDELR